MAVFSLARAGYGSMEEIAALDTPEFLDLVEYHEIVLQLQWWQEEQAKNGGHRK